MTNKEELLNLVSKLKENRKEDVELQDILSKITDFVGVVEKLDIPATNLSFDKSLFSEEAQKLLDLLVTDEWPEAVPEFLICSDSDEDKNERAEGILDYIGDDLSGKKVVDFGCGEGHVAIKAGETALKSVGYDIVKTGNLVWEDDSKLLTTDFSKVLANGPYDLVILYDVLDHSEDPVAVLNQVKTVCGSDTKIFIRCHSWMSRHGGHLYKQLNKAWLHLFFTEEELSLMGIKLDFCQKYYFPIFQQKQWFDASGLNVNSEDVIKTIVEPFFRKNEFSNRIPKDYKEFPEFQMSQVFNDYILRIK